MSPAMWDPRLIMPNRAVELVGDWPVAATYELAELSQFEPEGGGEPQPDQWQVNLRCQRPGRRGAACGQSVAMLGVDGRVSHLTPSDFLAAVLRHAVIAHDVPLSGVGRRPAGGQDETERPAAGGSRARDPFAGGGTE